MLIKGDFKHASYTATTFMGLIRFVLVALLMMSLAGYGLYLYLGKI